MKTIEIEGTERSIAARSSEQCRAIKEIRKNKGVPCVIYGGKENLHFTVVADALRHLVYTPNVYVVNLTIGAKKMTAIMKDIQFHPVREEILHVDFMEIDENKPITIEVPVQLEGLSEGVKAGGKLTLQKRKLKVKALYKNIPDRLLIDVTNLGLGKTIQVGQLNYDNLELKNVKNNVVCAVQLTRAARGLAAASKEAGSK